jgi:hypothetical protein
MANPFIQQQDPEELAILRRQRMAEQLMQQAQQPMEQGQMVSGIYVKPNFTQYLAKGLQQYMGARVVQQAAADAKALYEGRQAETQADQQKVIDLLRGKPAITLPQDQQGPVAPEQPADIKSAFATAAQSRNPALQNFGMQGILTQAETQAKLAQQNTLRQQNAALWKSVNGDAQAFLLAGGDPTIAKEFAESKGLGKGKIKNADGTLYNEDTGEILKTLPNPNKPFNADGTRNQAFIDYEITKAASGAPNVNTVVSPALPENTYNKKISDLLAESNMALVEGARNAPTVVENSRSIKSALDKGAITGTGAEARLAVQKAAETLGLVEPGTAATTQQLMSGLSKLTLNSIKASGLGGGQGFTNTDREFLNAAVSGSIADTPQNLRRVADLSERAAISTHAKGKKVLFRWQADPALSAVAQDYTIDELPTINAIPTAPVDRPPLTSFNRGNAR